MGLCVSGGETEAEEVKLLLEVTPAGRWLKKKKKEKGGAERKRNGWGAGHGELWRETQRPPGPKRRIPESRNPGMDGWDVAASEGLTQHGHVLPRGDNTKTSGARIL